MVWVLEIKGYHQPEDSNKFTAIIPRWSGYSKHYYLRPVNHIKIIGVTVRIEDFGKTNAYWHPDNVYSEKWVEVILKWCKWQWNDRDEYIIKECHDLTYPNYLGSCKSPLYKYYVRASELQKVAGDIRTRPKYNLDTKKW